MRFSIQGSWTATCIGSLRRWKSGTNNACWCCLRPAVTGEECPILSESQPVLHAITIMHDCCASSVTCCHQDM